MQSRRFLRVGDLGALNGDAALESEAQLRDVLVAHPEILPSSELGMGPLVTVAGGLDLGSGPIDVLAADGAGRLALVSCRRDGEERPARDVLAGVLAAGSALWRMSYEDLAAAARRGAPGFAGRLVDHVGARLRELGVDSFDGDAFRRGVHTSLESGDFVFVHAGLELDEATTHTIAFLAEGPRLRFFGVEVDTLATGDDSAMLVPRLACLPAWVVQRAQPGRMPSRGRRALASEDGDPVRELAQRVDEVAEDMGLAVSQARASRIWRPSPGTSTVLLRLDGHKVQFDLDGFRAAPEGADGRLERLDGVAGQAVRQGSWPDAPPEAYLYFIARLTHVRDESGVRAVDVSGADSADGAVEPAEGRFEPAPADVNGS